MSEAEIAPNNAAVSPERDKAPAETPDPTFGISREEAQELRMLVAAERNGEDVAYAAFHSLCPTGEEFAFDDKACAVYRVLAKRGLIEGADTDNGFLFFNLTRNGRDASAAYDKMAEDDDAQKRREARSLSGRFSFDPATVLTSAIVAAVVGFLAGILGSLVGAAL